VAHGYKSAGKQVSECPVEFAQDIVRICHKWEFSLTLVQFEAHLANIVEKQAISAY
jgi:hypothetical protein